MSFSYGTMWPVYAKQWDEMEAINAEWKTTFRELGEHAISNKSRYQGVERDTGVPWMMIAAIHMRESDCDFDTYLGNGEAAQRGHDAGARGTRAVRQLGGGRDRCVDL